MAEDQDKKEGEKFQFTPEGEVLGYISLDQARLLAMQTARDSPGDYGRRFRQTRMAFEVVEDHDTEDHYVVALSVRPQGQFSGTPGQEQFFIEKEGTIAYRQVLSVPLPAAGRRFPLIPAIIGLVVVAVLTVAVMVFALNGGGGRSEDTVPLAAASPTSTPASPIPTPLPASTSAPLVVPPAPPTATPILAPGPTATPLAVPPMVPTATRTPASIPANAPVLVPTETPSPVETPTPGLTPTLTPTRTPTRTPTPTPQPQQSRMLHWWPGDGHSDDIVGNNDGVLLGGATFAPGKVGQAFSFDGVDDWVNVPAKRATKFTVEAWVFIDPTVPGPRPGEVPLYYTIYADGIQGYFLRDRQTLWWKDGDRSLGHSVIPSEEWHHVAVTYDGRTFLAYIDGEPDGVSSSDDGQSLHGGRMGIGGFEGLSYFNGLIDEVKIYNHALSAEKIQAFYMGGESAYRVTLNLGENVDSQEVSLNAGDSLQLVVDVQDSDGNRVSGSLMAWQVDPDVGTLDDDGIFTAGTKAGTFPSGIEVNVVHEGERASGIVDVVVLPGPIASIDIKPSGGEVEKGGRHKFDATGIDEYGNEIGNIEFLWDATGGSISQNGLYTAGDAAGSYELKAKAAFGGRAVDGAASVSVLPSEIYLASLQPTQVRVGFLKFSVGTYEEADPTINVIPGDSIIARGIVFGKGLFAHAPSSLKYKLGGRYDSLKSAIGIGDI